MNCENISTKASTLWVSSPVEGNIDRDGGGWQEVRDEVPLDNLGVGTAGLQEGGGEGLDTGEAAQHNSDQSQQTSHLHQEGFEGNIISY